jgi:hypothetical protein
VKLEEIDVKPVPAEDAFSALQQNAFVAQPKNGTKKGQAKYGGD